MSTAPTLLDAIQLETRPDPTVAVIWLHGLGADGSDFVPIVRELDLRGCPGIRFVFPHAPTMPVTINNGYVMRAWYDILGSQIDRKEDESGLRASQRAVELLIEREKSRGIASNRIILAGFSQGCAMTLQTGLRHPEKLGGLLCLSGYLPLFATIAAESHPVNQETPIFMAHGRMDPVIPIDRAEKSRDALRSLGYTVEWHDYAMPHSVCAEEVEDISLWFQQVLG
ncbi:alpha/beta hydrolase [Lacisediminimonas profundi]|uniref:alpha/beta hydrolase n=1 Tax=Lacisediminimonas profundi TaxID=2603856 RepID=UPI00124B32F8|nr:alpha/beta hydrolase [Lacisediminimonas profundi]